MTNHQNGSPVSPAVRRAQLGAELRRLRDLANRSADVVAAGVGWSASKLSRFELARTALRTTDVAALLAYYQVPAAEAARLMTLADEGTRKGWWETSDYAGLTAEHQALIALEHEATEIRQWAVSKVPALLQTEAYARYLVASWARVHPVPPGQVNRLVAARLRRQAIITGTQAEMVFVLDESVLRRCIGGPALMVGQMTDLATLAAAGAVTIRVLPAGAPQSGLPEFTLLHLPGRRAGGAARDTAVHEAPGDSYHFAEDEMRTFQLGAVFGGLADSAASEADSLAMITGAAEQWLRQIS